MADERVSPWAPLKSRLFLMIWLAALVSNTGSWMRDVASGWLMTELAPSPVMVSLVQAATTLPIFLLSLPAGALADIVDRRRMLIVVQFGLLIVAVLLALAAQADAMTPTLLLGLVLAGGVCTAIAGPAFQAIVPELVPKSILRPAIALNSLGFNISRAVGPALGGIVVAGAGAAAAYWLDAASYVLVVAVFLFWRRSNPPRDLPPESFLPAIRTGLFYALRSPDVVRVLVRAATFFIFASSYWALLPLIARQQLNGDAAYYGILLTAIGAGAVTGALLLPKLAVSADRLVLGGTLLTAAATLGLATFADRLVAPLFLFLNGVAWIAVLTTLNVAAQSALPNWVRARGMAVYLTVFFGSMTFGSALWGLAAQTWSIPVALLVSSAGAVISGSALAFIVRLPESERDLTPSMHWPEPAAASSVEVDRGPVQISIAYQIDAPDRTAFLTELSELAHIRRRDGAFGWRVFEDAADPRLFEEVYHATSWLEHLRQHRRVTEADRQVQVRVTSFHRGASPPVVRHLLAAHPDDAPAVPMGEHTH